MIKYFKSRKVKSPVRAHSTDAGIDFFIPSFQKSFQDKLCELNPHLFINDEIIKVGPNEKILIPAGIHTKFDSGNALIMMNKSGVASKLGLDVLACVIDEDYEGEIHINLVNTTLNMVDLSYDQKIVQGVLMPVKNDMPVEITSLDELYSNVSSERGAGGFGSSGN